ncbi:hypothetical protein V5T82_02115 [Magnetovibrio sp. PR-2]|uniref:hypothetical protein n=1 Tax=Magnetovibrio sp. PR-2 TaxID=3120356 RepID=UPI002FCE68BE
MLLDVRKLVFSDDLLKRAILEYFLDQKMQHPQSQIQKIRFLGTPGEKAQAVVEFMTADPKNPVEIHLKEDQVLTAMIMVCKAHHVPLPRDAVKVLQLTKQGLAMTISMKVDTPPPAANQRRVS